MDASYVWIVFALGAVLSWGAYGPTLHKGQSGFPDKSTAGLRAIICVGLAYFVVAILVPGFALWRQGKLSGFTTDGFKWATVAGALGAAGAICITYALLNGGTPALLMPLVFAGAPVVNVLVSSLLQKMDWGKTSPLFFVGMLLAAGGAFMVLRFKPPISH